MKNEEIIKKLEYIYQKSKDLLSLVMQKDYPVAGNIAIFAQSVKEFNTLNDFKKKITKPSNNPNQKYFELLEPLTFKYNNYLADTFTHLYIRKLDPSRYGKYLGDTDFVCSEEEYKSLKDLIQKGQFIGAEIYNRTGWDNIQITSEEFGVVSYLGTLEMALKSRVKFDNLTNI